MGNESSVCGKCRSKDVRFDGRAPDYRPHFKCGSCGHVWTNGHGGGIDYETASRNDNSPKLPVLPKGLPRTYR